MAIRTTSLAAHKSAAIIGSKVDATTMTEETRDGMALLHLKRYRNRNDN